MDPALLLRVIHDLQHRVVLLEAELEKAQAEANAKAVSAGTDAEVR